MCATLTTQSWPCGWVVLLPSSEDLDCSLELCLVQKSDMLSSASLVHRLYPLLLLVTLDAVVFVFFCSSRWVRGSMVAHRVFLSFADVDLFFLFFFVRCLRRRKATGLPWLPSSPHAPARPWLWCSVGDTLSLTLSFLRVVALHLLLPITHMSGKRRLED